MGHSTGRRSSKQPSRSSLTHTDSSRTSLSSMYSYSVLYLETEPRRTLGLLDSPSCSCSSASPAQLATCAKHRQGHRLQMMGSVVETISKHEPDSGPHLSCFSDHAVAHFMFLVLLALVVDKTVRSLIKGDQEEAGPGSRPRVSLSKSYIPAGGFHSGTIRDMDNP
ncbi:hypothetical protein CABS03_10210 [Colletotrichum abscissum]|uniref:Uncharacterized protein n=1 Tax=Colletotrichum abscissum TaxID=1671311 RepID=A0A9P9XKQ9_9PEZI|nr:hypothetical protein CABS02_03889 [Colletotrichum abscissum]